MMTFDAHAIYTLLKSNVSIDKFQVLAVYKDPRLLIMHACERIELRSS